MISIHCHMCILYRLLLHSHFFTSLHKTDGMWLKVEFRTYISSIFWTGIDYWKKVHLVENKTKRASTFHLFYIKSFVSVTVIIIITIYIANEQEGFRFKTYIKSYIQMYMHTNSYICTTDSGHLVHQVWGNAVNS